MTKRELIKALKAWDDDTEVKVAWSCECGIIVMESVTEPTPNGDSIQLNTESMDARAEAAYIENRKQNGKEV